MVAVSKMELKRYRWLRCSCSSWLEISVSETSARKQYAFVISWKMFYTAHLLNSFEFICGRHKLWLRN